MVLADDNGRHQTMREHLFTVVSKVTKTFIKKLYLKMYNTIIFLFNIIDIRTYDIWLN